MSQNVNTPVQKDVPGVKEQVAWLDGIAPQEFVCVAHRQMSVSPGPNAGDGLGIQHSGSDNQVTAPCCRED